MVERKVIPDLERQLKNVSGWGKRKKRDELDSKIKEEKEVDEPAIMYFNPWNFSPTNRVAVAVIKWV